MPYRYFIHLSFHGGNYHGWQIQPNAPTVQGLIEEGLTRVLKTEISVTGCGRTDTGVHAGFFAAHFDVENPLVDPENTAFRLDRYLPDDIAIQGILPVVSGGHARFSAIWREYQYTISTRKDPFRTDTAWLLPWKLDLDSRNLGAAHLMNYDDFECFSKVNTDVRHFRCDLLGAEWLKNGDTLVFRIRADRFLRNMVRAIVGTLVELGRGKIDLQDLESILLSHDRKKAGFSVPAKGLSLINVRYSPDIYSSEPVWFSKEFPDKVETDHSHHSQFHNGSCNESDE